MNLRSTFILAFVLVASSALCGQWDRLFEPGSLTSSLSMFMLIAVDFACIIHFFKRQQSAQVVLSAQLVSIVASVGMVLFCAICAILS